MAEVPGAVSEADPGSGQVKPGYQELADQVSRLTEALASATRDDLFLATSDGLFIADGTGRYLDVNPAGCRMVGYTRDELLRLNVADLVSIEDVPRQDALKGKLASGGVEQSERRLRRKDGTYVTAELTTNALSGGRMQAIVRDLSVRKQAAAAVRNEERLETILDAVGDPLFVKDDEHRVIHANRAFCEMFELARRDVLGKTLAENVAPDERWQFLAVDRRVLDTGVPDVREESLTLKGRPTRTIVTRKTRFIESSGEKFLVGSIHDVTERRRLEASLALADRLASMGMLAAGVGHEINNPLAYVLANSELLAQQLPRLVAVTNQLSTALRHHQGEAAFVEAAGGAADLVAPALLQDLVECAQQALEGTRRIQAISRRLGAFSRADRDTRERFDLRVAIDSAVTMSRNEVKYCASVVTEFGRVPPVFASEGKLTQVFLNLIINAAHAIGDGPVDQNRITIRTWATGDDVFAEVADTGPGISPENLERIFEPFFTTKKFGKGSGLGLSICRNIVAEFDGDLHVDTEVGKGTRFIVRLPANLAEAVTSGPPALVPKPPESTRRGRILVVDDEEPIRKTLARLFGRQHDVVTASSGREARALLEKDPAFDLILCDLMMPLVSGMDLHAWLVASAPALAARVVFISGGAFTERAAEYMATVSNRLVDKPFDAAKLKELVAEFIAAVQRTAG